MTQKNPIIEALSSAQKIAFSPFVFQATVAAKRLGILQCLADHPTGLTVDEIADATHLTPYAVQVVTELLTAADVTAVTDDRLTLTKTGDCLLLDTMTSVNLDFTADVCYRGLDHLQEALTTGTAAGLKELGNWTDTIYPHLFELSPRAKASWFGFDHFYSDGAFRDCARWLKKNVAPKRLFDVGGNTGKFAGVALREMPDLCVKIIDLPQQCRLAEENPDLADVRTRLTTAGINWLDPEALPETDEKADLIWMSQFLDCFTPDQAVSILTRMKAFLAPGGRIAVLECLWDRQSYEAARLSLLGTSLYFTAIANGNSRFFSDKELRKILTRAGLTIEHTEDRLGMSHTLLLCRPADE